MRVFDLLGWELRRTAVCVRALPPHRKLPPDPRERRQHLPLLFRPSPKFVPASEIYALISALIARGGSIPRPSAPNYMVVKLEFGLWLALLEYGNGRRLLTSGDFRWEFGLGNLFAFSFCGRGFGMLFLQVFILRSVLKEHVVLKPNVALWCESVLIIIMFDQLWN